jgi:hypothetical protein
VLLDGVPQQVDVETNDKGNGIVVQGDGWTSSLSGVGADGRPLPLTPEGALRVQAQRGVQTSGSGFDPGSQVGLYMDPPVESGASGAGAWWRMTVRAFTGEFLGAVTVDAQGSFRGTVTLPAGVRPGARVLQAVGLTPAGQSLALNFGVVVDPSVFITKGARKVGGTRDRITITGSSVGLPAGSTVTPYTRVGKGNRFVAGSAPIKVRSDGTFRWSRLVPKRQLVAVYVSFGDIESGRVAWVRAR